MRGLRRLPRALLCVTFLLTLGAFYPILQLLSLTSYGDPFNAHVVHCNVGEGVRRELLRAAASTSALLAAANVTTFLCYGSLWGYLRRGNLFPWDRTIRFCAFADEVERLDSSELTLQFSRKNLDLSYDSAFGAYTIRDQKYGQRASNPRQVVPEVALTLFRLHHALRVNGEQEDAFRRVGWRHRILPPGSEALQEFPERLVSAPLRSVTFSGLKVEIPHEGAELQKYHYKDDWWTEIRPEGCGRL